LRATSCSSWRWVAATTTPIPPSPRSLSTRYFPASTSPGAGEVIGAHLSAPAAPWQLPVLSRLGRPHLPTALPASPFPSPSPSPHPYPPNPVPLPSRPPIYEGRGWGTRVEGEGERERERGRERERE